MEVQNGPGFTVALVTKEEARRLALGLPIAPEPVMLARIKDLRLAIEDNQYEAELLGFPETKHSFRLLLAIFDYEVSVRGKKK